MENQENRDKWIVILKELINLKPTNDQFNWQGQEFRYQYVADQETRLGFLLIWDIKTLEAVNFSRVKVPDAFEFIEIQDEQTFADNIPSNLKFD
ncbi:hypothetical protein [Fluviicola sp.]|uniref:hypothetical protein n=1 Tax=Fluviicola sp. TaxID=1917219 RepID=UPI003D2E32EB